MKEERWKGINRILEDYAAQAVADNTDLWPGIRGRLQVGGRRTGWMRLRPTTRLGWAFLILTLLLVIGGTAYAVAPVLSELWQRTPGGQQVQEAGLAQEIHLSQTINDITVTLERVYADANQVLIGFTAEPSDPMPLLRSTRLSLANETGTILSGVLATDLSPDDLRAGILVHGDFARAWRPPEKGAGVLAFDAAPIQGTPEELSLRLEMYLQPAIIRDSSGQFSSSAPPASPTTEGEEQALTPYPPLRASPEEEHESTSSWVGPFTFEFAVPFIPGHKLDVHQTIEALGASVMLEEVVATPSETRAILSLNVPQAGEDWVPVAVLEPPTGEPEVGGLPKRLDEDTWAYQFFHYRGDHAGDWTLTVTELVNPGQPEEQEHLAGPWVFRFQIPSE